MKKCVDRHRIENYTFDKYIIYYTRSWIKFQVERKLVEEKYCVSKSPT